MEVTPISPLTHLRVCRGVPLDSSYTDTLTFSNKSEQLQYFAGKVKFAYDKMTPVRMNNVIRIPSNQDALFDCNYICFQNSNFGNKWLYAFITNFKYINPNMTEVSIELDVMQTWMFDYTVHPCMIVREHSNTDEYGENTVLEPIEVGEYVDEQSYRTGKMDDYSACYLLTPIRGDHVDGKIGGIFTGLKVGGASYDTSEQELISALAVLDDAGQSDRIVSTFIMPTVFFDKKASDPIEIQITVPKETTSLGEYVPRNKKLLCYPYNFMSISNTMGTVKTLRYEYFYNKGSSAVFTMSCPTGVNPEVVLFPHSYDNQRENYDNIITLSGFPQFAYSTDTYRAWCAQNGNTFAMSAVTSALLGTAGIMTGNPTALLSTSLGIANTMTALAEKGAQVNHSGGTQSTNSLVALKIKDFYFYQTHVREDYARILDDYFDRYGYITNRIKTPNITGRPAWNFVKTEDASITGSIPFEDIVKIKQNFNNGITFWHGEPVGDYSRNNQV